MLNIVGVGVQHVKMVIRLIYFNVVATGVIFFAVLVKVVVVRLTAQE